MKKETVGQTQYTMKQMEEKIKDYREIFDVVRLIDKKRMERMEQDCNNKDKLDSCPCYSF